MNKVILMGRLTRDPEVRYAQDTCIARYTLAVDRKYTRDGDDSADFINCVAFNKGAEFAEKYLRKGIKIAIVGRIKTGSYTNKDGVKVYTTDVVAEEQEFAESKSGSNASDQQQDSGTERSDKGSRSNNQPQYDSNGFMNIPDNIDEELPFT